MKKALLVAGALCVCIAVFRFGEWVQFHYGEVPYIERAAQIIQELMTTCPKGET